MDATAFDEDAGLTLGDVYHDLPEDFKRLIHIGRVVVAHGGFIPVGVLALIAWALMLSAVGLHWLLLRLTWRTSALLCVWYEVQEQQSNDRDSSTRDGDISNGHRRDGRPSDVSVLARSERPALLDSSLSSHSAAELDLFEAFLNSPNTPADQDRPAAGTVHVHDCSSSCENLKPQSRSEHGISESIDQQENRLKAQIEAAHNVNTDERGDSLNGNVDKANQTIHIDRHMQPSVESDDRESAKSRNGLSLSNATGSLTSSARRTDQPSKQEKSLIQREAAQTAWLESLMKGSSTPSQANAARSTVISRATASGTPQIGDITNRPTSGPLLKGSAGQLADAREFHKSVEPSTCGSKRGGRGGASHLNDGSSLLLRQRAVIQAAASQHASKPPRSSRLNEQPRSNRANAVNSQQTSAPAATSSGSLPPHLRKKQEAKAIKEASVYCRTESKVGDTKSTNAAVGIEDTGDGKLQQSDHKRSPALSALPRPAQRSMTAQRLRSLNTSSEQRDKDLAPGNETTGLVNNDAKEFQCAQCQRWAWASELHTATSHQLCDPCQAVDDRIDQAQSLISKLNARGTDDKRSSIRQQKAEAVRHSRWVERQHDASQNAQVKLCSYCGEYHAGACMKTDRLEASHAGTSVVKALALPRSDLMWPTDLRTAVDEPTDKHCAAIRSVDGDTHHHDTYSVGGNEQPHRNDQPPDVCSFATVQHDFAKPDDNATERNDDGGSALDERSFSSRMLKGEASSTPQSLSTVANLNKDDVNISTKGKFLPSLRTAQPYDTVGQLGEACECEEGTAWASGRRVGQSGSSSLGDGSTEVVSQQADAQAASSINQHHETGEKSTTPSAVRKQAVEVLNHSAEKARQRSRSTQSSASRRLPDSQSEREHDSVQPVASDLTGYQHPDLSDLPTEPKHLPRQRSTDTGRSALSSSLSASALPFFAPSQKISPEKHGPAVNSDGHQTVYELQQRTLAENCTNSTDASQVSTSYDMLERRFRGYLDETVIARDANQRAYDMDKHSSDFDMRQLQQLESNQICDSLRLRESAGPTARAAFVPLKALPILNPGALSFHSNKYSVPDWPELPSVRTQDRSIPIMAPPGLGMANLANQARLDAIITDARSATGRSNQPQGYASDGHSAMNSITDFNRPDHTNYDSPDRVQSTADARNSGEHLEAEPPDTAETEQGTEADGSNVVRDAALEDTISTIGSVAEPQLSLKKRKKAARETLREAWSEREENRASVLADWSFDKAKALSAATTDYTTKRSELAECMASGELNEQDAKEFPHFSTTDVSKPRLRPTGIQSRQPSNNTNRDITPTAQSTTTATMARPATGATQRDNLFAKALEARDLYEEAYAYFDRPPPEGRASRRDLKAQGEARIDRAIRLYKQRREELQAACPGGLPEHMKLEMWENDDKAEKRGRGKWGF